MFFDDSRPDRAKRARREGRAQLSLAASPVPPPKAYEYLTHDEIVSVSRTLTGDVECYVNYWCVSFQCVETGKVVTFECKGDLGALDERQRKALAFILYRHRIVGFNSINYDMVIIAMALQGVPCFKLKEVSDEIILQGMRPFEIERKYNLPRLNVNHIDLIEVAPIEASLKLYAARLHCERLQDLPFEPDSWLADDQMPIVRDYNVNDLELTGALYKHLKPQLDLRETLGKDYGLDLRSKSDAQIAEAVIGAELTKLGVKVTKPDIEPGKQFKYQPPAFLAFKTPQLQHVFKTICDATFEVAASGYVDLPTEVKALAPRLGGGEYRLGIGGLHSSEKSVGYEATPDMMIVDDDVASFYPRIILNCRFYPKHLTDAFLKVYDLITNRRLKAKLDKLKSVADSLKIVINGCFGKLGNPFSIFYSPDLLIQVTITGQLSLLMLIEMIELAGISVVSANTDGIVKLCPPDRYDDLRTVIMQWEEATGFVTEEERYKSIWSRDVNNYIAVKEDGTCKLKGCYAEVGSALNSPLSKNPEAYIVSLAVQEFLANGTPVAETIEAGGAGLKAEHYPTAISRFVSVKRVRGGAHKAGVYLGKVVRWYYAKGEEGVIETVTHGSTVGKSEGAKPLMMLPDAIPADLDIDWYINEANNCLYDLGRYKRQAVAKLI
jgi:hypothetical protein